MKMKSLIRKLRRIVLFFVLVIFMLLSIINAPWFFVSDKTSDTDYSGWMNDTLDENQKIIDVKMLGAHDAFSHEINIFSKVDPASADGIMQGFIGNLIKGFSVRQSKTQVVGAKELLKSGVRYLDLRLSLNPENDDLYTVHNYFSTEFAQVLTDIESFLEENPGEFIIIDLQHAYGMEYDDPISFSKVEEIFIDYGIIDYAYSNKIKNLEDITYGDMTSNKSSSGVIIFSKFTTESEYFWDYNDYIRSEWANEDEFSKIIDFLIAEKNMIESDSNLQNKIRVMQAVATMEMSITGIIRSFETWSLLSRARAFNQYLLEYERFDDLVESMPIVMIDYSSDYKIIDQFMEIIIDKNQDSTI